MRIDNHLSVGIVEALRGKSVRGARETAGPSEAVDLSGRIIDIQTAMEGLAAAPDVREETVAALRAQVQSGTFAVDAQALAEKLLSRPERDA